MRRQLVVVLFVLAATALLVQARVSAHHAFAAEFDQNAPMTLDGTLKRVEWINPHSWVHVDVKDPDTGQIVEWMVEGGAPSNLLKRGFGKNTVPVGAPVHVEGYRAKNRSLNRMNGHIIENSQTGEAFFLGSSGTGAPYDAVPGVQYDANGRPIKK